MAGTYSPESLGIKAPSGGFATGGWYSGRQYWNGTFSDPGVIHPGSNQSGAGSPVSNEVNSQSASAQGVSVQNFNEYLANASAQNIQSPVTPAYTTGATQNYVSGLSSQVDAARNVLTTNLAEQQAKNDKEMATAKAKEQAALSEVEKLTTPFRADLEKTERERLETDKVLSDQKGLLTELDQLLTEGNTLIKQQQEVTGLSAIRNPRVQKTMDDITGRAGVIEAVVNLQNTYLSNAYTSIDRSVKAIYDDRTDRLAYYDAILKLADRDIVSLDAKSTKIAEEQTTLLKNDLSRAQATEDYVKEMLVDPDKALLMAQAGVSLNDSVEQINLKLSKAQYANEIRDLSNGMASSGYSAVIDPKSVAANKLVTITDSQGKKYYYRKAETGTTGFDTSTFFQKLSDLGYKVSGTESTSPSNQVDINLLWDEVLTDSPSASYSTYAGVPSFSPAGGIGTIWTDTRGNKWKYTASGWVKA